MTEERGRRLDINGIIEQDAQKKRERHRKTREITFRQYLDLLTKEPSVAKNAPSRLLETILCYGKELIPEDQRRFFDEKEVKYQFKLFSESLFGLFEPISRLVSFWEAGAAGLSTGKQVLLLVGPTSSGKSSIAELLKEALVSQQKPIFAIKGCPIHEEPLHLLPKDLKEKIGKELGINIEGDLCPVCRYHLMKSDKFGKFVEDDGVVRWGDFPVEEFTFSIRDSRGIASHEPTDDKAADITELTGKENLTVLADPNRGPNDPFAYTLNGEICRSNRGIFEGIEWLKNDHKILRVFISLNEERRIKITGSGFPHIYIDTNCLTHTNLAEFKKFSSNKENEALQDRIYVVSVPYSLRISDEVKIYRKLIEKESALERLGKIHIAPGALEIGAMFAVLTRYQEKNSQNVSKVVKMKLYNGEAALTELEERDLMPVDVRALRKEGQSDPDLSKREGMFGASPRDILSAINIALAEQKHKNGCLTPLTVLRALKSFSDHRTGYTDEQKEKFSQLLSSVDGDSVVGEYRDYALKAVSKAFLRAYDDLAKELFNKYIKEIELWRSQKRKFVGHHIVDAERDPRTGELKQPDVKLMRSIEQFIPIDESMADSFRGEILEVRASSPNFSYTTYRPLARAVEKKLLDDTKHTMTLVLSQEKAQNEESRKRSHDLQEALKGDNFCDTCAKELMEQAAAFLKE